MDKKAFRETVFPGLLVRLDKENLNFKCGEIGRVQVVDLNLLTGEPEEIEVRFPGGGSHVFRRGAKEREDQVRDEFLSSYTLLSNIPPDQDKLLRSKFEE